MSDEPPVHTSDNGVHADGWTIARCMCGWTFGPCPDDVTATDVLMEHAYAAGWADRHA